MNFSLLAALAFASTISAAAVPTPDVEAPTPDIDGLDFQLIITVHIDGLSQPSTDITSNGDFSNATIIPTLSFSTLPLDISTLEFSKAANSIIARATCSHPGPSVQAKESDRKVIRDPLYSGIFGSSFKFTSHSSLSWTHKSAFVKVRNQVDQSTSVTNKAIASALDQTGSTCCRNGWMDTWGNGNQQSVGSNIAVLEVQLN